MNSNGVRASKKEEDEKNEREKVRIIEEQ